ncbi:MAG TPA: hypothetical protein VGN82_14135 [Bosea sp. (in: a-proteobacteria)]|jgi:drug/metabolite transporter (DMT)-like permease|uniref:Pam3-gp28 family putative phage holin n=1 Tax=Bosea sp. (in: a-proteobacteria) TaxID=1871050 RepID=UPI002E136117|nr:hypothetical protein [Bosea sp. (in: a-proteobacteria)]
MFTIEQFWSLVRTVLQMAGAALVTRGYLDDGSMQVLLGAVMAIITTIYSVWIRRKAGLVAAAAALPEVREIRTTPAIAAKVEDPTVTVS